jgi:hypothetical protein
VRWRRVSTPRPARACDEQRSRGAAWRRHHMNVRSKNASCAAINDGRAKRSA